MKLTIEPIYDDDGQPGWFVRVVEKPGCMSQGDTIAEALAMIADAMQTWDEAGQAAQPGAGADPSARWHCRAALPNQVRQHADCSRQRAAVTATIAPGWVWLGWTGCWVSSIPTSSTRHTRQPPR